MNKPAKVAFVGLGARGRSLLNTTLMYICEDYGIEVVAVYDSYEDRTADAVALVQEKTGKTPIAAKSYQEILDNPEIEGVVIGSAWEAHIPQAVAAMKAGKYPAIEVGGAYTIEDCWKLVDTYEETGIPCMMLENCCYAKFESMILNMVRQGLFGEIVHCAGGYRHDLRYEVAEGVQRRHYRLRNYLNRNCDNYPTHALGPIGKILDINDGNRMVSLTSTASCAKGLHAYILDKEGPESPLANVEFTQGDIVTTVIKCAKGQTITLTLDTSLPRPYSRDFAVHGTKGCYFGLNNLVFEDSVHKDFHTSVAAQKIWGNGDEYFEKYAHPLWKDYNPKGGHGGMDYLVLCAYFESLTTGSPPPIDAYDAASYMSITALSEESILKGSAPVAIPDFTRGKWYQREKTPDSQFKLNR